MGARRAVGRARGLLRLPPRPAGQHPQREPARSVARPRRRRGRPASASSEPSSGRSMPSVPMAHGRTARARTSAGPTPSTPATCSSAWTGCAMWSRASRTRSLEAPPTTSASSTPPAGRCLWADKPFPEDAHSAGTGLSTLGAPARAADSSSASCSSASRGACSTAGYAAATPCTAATACGPDDRALPALVRRPRRARGSSMPRQRSSGAEDMAPRERCRGVRAGLQEKQFAGVGQPGPAGVP